MAKIKFKPILAIVVIAILLAGGFWYKIRFLTWEEEVLLPDGRYITVSQKRDYIENYGTKETWLTFSLPEMNGSQTWNEFLMPVAIGVSQGTVYVIGMPRGLKQYEIYANPRYFIVAFAWTENSFKRIPLTQVPGEVIRIENVFRCIPLSKEKYLSWPSKISKWCAPSVETENGGRAINTDILEKISKKYAALNGQTKFSE